MRAWKNSILTFLAPYVEVHLLLKEQKKRAFHDLRDWMPCEISKYGKERIEQQALLRKDASGENLSYKIRKRGLVGVVAFSVLLGFLLFFMLVSVLHLIGFPVIAIATALTLPVIVLILTTDESLGKNKFEIPWYVKYNPAVAVAGICLTIGENLDVLRHIGYKEYCDLISNGRF